MMKSQFSSTLNGTDIIYIYIYVMVTDADNFKTLDHILCSRKFLIGKLAYPRDFKKQKIYEKSHITKIGGVIIVLPRLQRTRNVMST